MSLTESEIERDMFFGGDNTGRDREDSIMTSLVGFANTANNAQGAEIKMQREIKELS